MEHVLSALRSHESKIRLSGVGAADPFVDDEGWEDLTSALVGCLTDNNSKVSQGSLKVLAKVVASPRKSPDAIRPWFGQVWGSLKEKMGDSKLPVREAATDLLLVFMEKLGMSSVMDRLKLCAAHKNWRTREQILLAMLLAMERFRDDPYRLCLDGLVDLALNLLEDSTKEVRDASINVLEALYKIQGHTLLSDLQSKHIRNTHMRMLLTRFGADDLSSLTLSTKPRTSPPASSRSIQSQSPPRVIKPSKAGSSVASTGSLSLSPSSSKPMSTSVGTHVNPLPAAFGSALNHVVCKYSERELLIEMQQIAHGLATGTDWAKRVDALQHLQRIVANGGAQLAVFVTSLRPLREPICEQVSDLRSTVSREACATITTLATCMGDDTFHPFVEYFVAALLKATFVTIQVISTSADACLKSIVLSGRGSGYPKALPKFLEGAKARNQVLRLHCVEYLTLALSCWHVSVLDKYIDLLAALLPVIILDAQADVRAAARKCFWAFHSQYETRALNILYNHLDSSTQRRLHDDKDTALGLAKALSPQDGAGGGSAPGLTSWSLPSRQPSVVQTPIPPPVPATTSLKVGALRVQNSDAAAATTTVATAVTGAARVLNRKSLPAKDPDDPSAPVRLTVQGPLRVLNPSPAPPENVATAAVSIGAKRVETGAPAAKQSSVVTLPASSRYELHSGHSDSAPPPPSQPPTSSQTHGSSNKQLRSVDENNMDDAKDDIAVAGLFEKADDSLWLTRLEALERLAKLVEMRNPANAPIVTSAKLPKLLQKRVGDSHYRVVQAALKLTLVVLTSSTAGRTSSTTTTTTLLPWKTILPKVFLKAVDSKDSVRAAAIAVLEAFAANVEPSALAMAVVSTMLDGIPVKVKAVVFQFVAPLVPSAIDLFSNATFLRSVVLKIVLFVEQDASSSAATTAAVGSLINALYNCVGPSMAAVESQLPSNKVMLLQRYLSTSSGANTPSTEQGGATTSLKRSRLAFDGETGAPSPLPIMPPQHSPRHLFDNNLHSTRSDAPLLQRPTADTTRNDTGQDRADQAHIKSSEFERVLARLESTHNNASHDDKLHATESVVVLFQHAPDDLVDVYLPQTIPALLDVALECGGSIEFNVVQARVMQTIQTLVTHHAQTIARHLEPIAVLVLERCSASLTPSSLMLRHVGPVLCGQDVAAMPVDRRRVGAPPLARSVCGSELHVAVVVGIGSPSRVEMPPLGHGASGHAHRGHVAADV
ncbi:hypothetical protein, variant [Aphanomyces invadans]|uniref:TOG domain-containing protein n=1 Tax=Aphanomyces invadans TaxID=157072 RepID=A0A024UKX4_9STRA|nr:hypothetical protein, variant [Aphanomyces invadans]ETW06497.1 hypothetical protein, variant [Aphanomyces invadans]|eukprot:XP_008864572.1 hypothetical protein, variant [Aphanomyces invadans]